jgi:hypothetical protein
MDSDRADRVGYRIAEIVHVDPDRDPGSPFADRLEVRQAVTRLAPSRMSKPSTLGGAHSVTVIVPSEVSPKCELRRRGHRAETERAIRIQLDVRVPSWVVLSAPDGQPIPGVGDRVVEDSAERQFHRILA